LIRVLIVEDHASLRESMAFVFEQQPDFGPVAQAGSIAEALPMLQDVDVAVVDLKLPDGDGVQLVGKARAANPHGKVLILTGSTSRLDFARAVEAGVAGVLNKSVPVGEVIDAVRRLHRGEVLLSRLEVTQMLRLAGQQHERDRAAQLILGELTPREREVLQLLADGSNDKEIAEQLTISNSTARAYMSSILAKLGVDSRLQALLFAVKHGAVEIELPE
jgi:DNA-binding NarL/FixJ family response regulator